MVSAYWEDEWLTVYQGDCREVMRSMEPESVHCVVTSPPYWGLRDYGDAGQLGLEPTPEEYVANMVDVFREVRRVLRSDGTVWLNLGDSYASGEVGRVDGGASADGSGAYQIAQRPRRERRIVQRTGLKHKDLVGIPWRVAFALQADGWYLRSDIIWSKPNPMPESVTDRPTKSHEYLFLLSKSPRYYFDADAVREPHSWGAFDDVPGGQKHRVVVAAGDTREERNDGLGLRVGNPAGRNLRSVWTIATQPYPGAHFATFPRKLVEPCIKAGTSERGVCPECGAPWVRVASVVKSWREDAETAEQTYGPGSGNRRIRSSNGGMSRSQYETTGWRPSCDHDLPAVPATCLDPFAGSGTTALVAQSLGRRAILIDLSTDYLAQIMRRNAQMPLPA